MSAVTDWTDRTTCVLVGDGAGAAVVEACPADAAGPAGIGPVLWGSVPEMGHAVRIEGTPSVFAQEGQSVYRWATTQLPRIARQACERAGLGPEDLAAVVLHQANLRIIEPLAAKIGAVNAVVARDVVESGNTSAASIPLAFSKLVERGEISTGDPVLLFGFGGNLSYAGQVVRCRELSPRGTAMLSGGWRYPGSNAPVRTVRMLLEAGAAGSRPRRQVAMNARLHAKVMELAGNAVLAELAAQVDRRVRWYCTPVARQRGQQSWIEHRELIAAIANRDEQRATEIMRAHTEHTRKMYHEREK